MRLGVIGFFEDIRNFVRGGRVLGVDIGTVSVKAAELTKRGDRFRLESYGILSTKGYLDFPNQAIQGSALKISDRDAAKLVKALLREMGPKTGTALFTLPSFAVFVVPLELPLMTPKETAQAVAFQARQFIPLPPSEVSLDWTRVGAFQDVRGQQIQRILLIGIPKELVEAYKRIAKFAGLRLVSLEFESLAVARALAPYLAPPTLVVDIGGEATNVCVIAQGTLMHNAQVEYGGLYLTQALKRSLGISMQRAEDLKRRRGLAAKGTELELSTLLLSFLDVIIGEVGKVKDFYETRYGQKLEKLILLGGGGHLSGLEAYVGGKLHMALQQASAFLDVWYPPELEAFAAHLTRDLSGAIGVAKRYFAQ